jgi:RNA polymerase sigma-70 factor (ECF subfamily)
VSTTEAPAVGVDFTDWVRPHLPAMSRLAARLTTLDDRDDVLQDALTSAWRKFDRYDAERGGPQAWLLAIVADQARKTRRRRKPTDPLPDRQAPTDHAADIDIERAVGRLPRRQRLAVALHYFLDLPVAEVAAVMKCSDGTVKATLSHARARLRRELGEEFR